MKKSSLKEVDIYTAGLVQLEGIEGINEEVLRWKDILAELSNDQNHRDDAFVWLSCVEALEAVAEGNYGVGAILVNEKKEVIIRGHNHSYAPVFRSDLHAEMVILNHWEQDLQGYRESGDKHFRLFSSLEPCPMCLTRLLYSNIKGIHYAAQDDAGGMLRNVQQMPPFFRNLAQRHILGRAEASPALFEAARKIMDIGLEEKDGKVR